MRIRERQVVGIFLLTLFPVHGFGAEATEPPLQLEEVVDGVYSVRRKFVGSNAAVIINDRDVVVVDTHASPAGARGTLAAIREITDKPVRYVVNTHWHTDHFVGNRAYLDAFPGQVEFISHETVRQDIADLAPEQLPIAVRYIREDVEMATRMLLTGEDENEQPLEPAQLERLRRFVDDQSRTLEELDPEIFVVPDMTIEQGLTLHRGERQIQVLYLGRGHTRGDLVVYLPEQRTLITGDLLTHPMLHVGGTSRPVEWLASLKALAALDADTYIPGHGEVVRGREYPELVIEILGAVVEHVQDGLDRDLKFAEIEPSMSLEDLYAQWVGDDRERGAMFEAAQGFVPDALGRTYLELTGRLD